MVTKTIKGKTYELYDYFKTLAEAEKVAKDLNGRLHIITGKITETEVTKVPKTKSMPIKYAVWHRKI